MYHRPVTGAGGAGAGSGGGSDGVVGNESAAERLPLRFDT